MSGKTAAQSMNHKIGNNPFILPSKLNQLFFFFDNGKLNQLLMILIHQTDGFVNKLMHIHVFLEWEIPFQDLESDSILPLLDYLEGTEPSCL